MIYTFKLYRRIRNRKTGGVIISAFDLDRECENPFRERMKLCREFPRWAIGSDFKSDVDKEYDASLIDPLSVIALATIKGLGIKVTNDSAPFDANELNFTFEVKFETPDNRPPIDVLNDALNEEDNDPSDDDEDYGDDYVGQAVEGE